ncbi:Putative mrna splicing protein smn survival motor neuron [Trichuris trichiura]|uniref:Putative mrna splicing protein smn survival motor neuron n=1 Tax=Trichuris trichiura TaxID=36087 RepID=A0A077ZEJ9_TRITR|nr:Putative mrna splicing protein smn survival motor neuron [Trichuris trichiura]
MAEEENGDQRFHEIDFMNPDAWDDTELVAAYDSEMQPYKEMMNDIVANIDPNDDDENEENRQSGTTEETETDEQSTVHHPRCQSVFGKKRGYTLGKRKKRRLYHKGWWKAGDVCMAKFCGDGTYRKARVHQVLSRRKLLVVFDGYENEIGPVLVRWNHISPYASTEQDFNCLKQYSDEIAGNGNLPNNPPANSTGSHPSMSLGKLPVAIPPPYLPNMDNALNAMLISWYMAGYHAGFYQASTHSRFVVTDTFLFTVEEG